MYTPCGTSHSECWLQALANQFKIEWHIMIECTLGQANKPKNDLQYTSIKYFSNKVGKANSSMWSPGSSHRSSRFLMLLLSFPRNTKKSGHTVGPQGWTQDSLSQHSVVHAQYGEEKSSVYSKGINSKWELESQNPHSTCVLTHQALPWGCVHHHRVSRATGSIPVSQLEPPVPATPLWQNVLGSVNLRKTEQRTRNLLVKNKTF